MKKQEISIFATSFKNLMDSCEVDRHGWARILKVDQDSVDKWLADVSLPSPFHIRMVIDLAERLEIDKTALKNFYEISNLSSELISPRGHLMGASLGRYVAQALYEGMLQTLQAHMRLTPLNEQRDLYEKLTVAIHSVLDL